MLDTKFFDTINRRDKFLLPWNDYISRQVPISIYDALYWCEYIALSNQTMAAAIRKLVSYFITEIEVYGTDRKEAERLKDYLYNVLYIDNVLHSLGLDHVVYGNSFSTIWLKINRSVICPSCGYSTALLPYINRYENAEFKLEGTSMHLRCVKCGYKGIWNSIVTTSNNPEDVNIIRWNVHDILINQDPLSGDTEYLWKISPEYKTQIQRNNVLYIANAPDSLLQAIKDGHDFALYSDRVIHLAEPTLSGMRMGGWGMSPILANFRQCWYLDVLRMANQMIAQDFIIPIRILSPETRAAGPEFGDPTFVAPFPEVNAQLKNIIETWRKDPTNWYSAPFPVRYQVIGGEGGRIIPYQLIEQGNVDLISAMGMPVEFFRGNLSVTAAPMALRLLEGTWSSIPKLLNKFLDKLAIELSTRFRWDSFKLRLAKPSHVDDVNRQMAKLQLALQGAVSMTTGLKSIGLSFEEEVKRQMEEEEIKAEEAKRLQESLSGSALNEQLATPQQQEGDLASILGGLGGLLGGAAPGTPQGSVPAGSSGSPPTGGSGGAGLPPSPGPMTNDPIQQVLAMVPGPETGPVTISDLLSSAEQIAQRLYGMHPTLRSSALRKLSQKNEVIHALVIKKLEDMANAAALQGKVQAQQQAQQQAQAAGAALPL